MMKSVNKGRTQNLLMVLAVAFVAYLLFTTNNKSKYSIREREYSMLEMAPAAGPSVMKNAPDRKNGCGMDRGTGLASSLLPREVASAEDFGEFAPEDILAGQNFLEPRQHIGFPESIGGALRNANQQIRAEPANPKEPFVWNNSTIVPDTMMRSLC